VDDFGAKITGTGPAMFHSDGTPIKSHWRRLAHPSAQFVRGEVLANIFDFTVGTFNLTFVPSTDCDLEGPDAVIVWPWTWWAYINITSLPQIDIAPSEAAVVHELAQGGQGFATPVVRFAVQALRRDKVITVTLSFVNFKNIDLIPEEPEPTVFGPWYQGLAWPVVVFFLLLTQAIVFFYCCRFCCCCCCAPGWYDGNDISTDDTHLAAIDVDALRSCRSAECGSRCRSLLGWMQSKAMGGKGVKDESEHLLAPEASETPPLRSPAPRSPPSLEPREPEPEAITENDEEVGKDGGLLGTSLRLVDVVPTSARMDHRLDDKGILMDPSLDGPESDVEKPTEMPLQDCPAGAPTTPKVFLALGPAVKEGFDGL